MAQEEKFEEAKRLYETANANQRYVLESLFPELKESEDERIRKALVEMVHDTTGDSLWVDYGVHKEDAIAYLEKQGEQKPAEWSKIDKANLEDSIYFVKEFRRSNLCDNESRLQNSRTCIEWLASLKDRVQPQPKQEWSEEDENHVKSILSTLEYCKVQFQPAVESYNADIEWLKSLRPQNTWKPSEEQIKVCKEVYADILSAKGFDLGTVNSELNRLEEELKKLMEE